MSSARELDREMDDRRHEMLAVLDRHAQTHAQRKRGTCLIYRRLKLMLEEMLYELRRVCVEKLARAKHRETSSETFCREWAKLESRDAKFQTRHEDCWVDKPWRVEFYDRHRWDGKDVCWNGHDVGRGQGNTLEDAWRDLETAMLEYSHAKSREEALMKAELNAHADLPRGWGHKEHGAC